jgi:hypothetical protein
MNIPIQHSFLCFNPKKTDALAFRIFRDSALEAAALAMIWPTSCNLCLPALKFGTSERAAGRKVWHRFPWAFFTGSP